MSDWSLADLLGNLHDDIERRLADARKLLGHPVAKGDASEEIWLELLSGYLPERYRAQKAFVVDSNGQFSEQIDIVVFDRHYSPIIFKYKGSTIVPAESVYAVFETKQTINSDQVAYAQRKVASVRKLKRTTLPIRHAGGTFAPVEPRPIVGGILTFESDWKPPLGSALLGALIEKSDIGRLDIGCVAAHGIFLRNHSGNYSLSSGGKPATSFLLELIAQLQELGTVPRLDIRSYAEWLTK